MGCLAGKAVLRFFWTHSARCIHRAWYDVLLLRFIA